MEAGFWLSAPALVTAQVLLSSFRHNGRAGTSRTAGEFIPDRQETGHRENKREANLQVWTLVRLSPGCSEYTLPFGRNFRLSVIDDQKNRAESECHTCGTEISSSLRTMLAWMHPMGNRRSHG